MLAMPHNVVSASPNTWTTRKRERQRYWQENYPDLEHADGLKLAYLRGALTMAIVRADGEISKEELLTAKQLAEWATQLRKDEAQLFMAGFNDVKTKQLSVSMLFQLCGQIKSKKHNLNTIKLLFKLSAADGTLDKAEYNFIRKVAMALELNIPPFEDLATRLNVETGHAQREKALRVTGNAVKAVGKGAFVVVSALVAMLYQNNHSKSDPVSPRTKRQVKPTTVTKVLGAKTQVCTICQFWSGPRDLKYGHELVEYFDVNERSKCLNLDAEYKRHPVRPLHTCKRWEKWSAMK